MKSNVLILRHTVDCFVSVNGKGYAPMIDPITVMLSGINNKEFITTTLKGSRVKLPGDNLFDSLVRYFALCEKALYKLFRLPTGSTYIEIIYWNSFLKRKNIKKILGIEPTQSLLIASKALSIKTCEVQHGVVSTSHPLMKKENSYADFFFLGIRDQVKM